MEPSKINQGIDTTILSHYPYILSSCAILPTMHTTKLSTCTLPYSYSHALNKRGTQNCSLHSLPCKRRSISAMFSSSKISYTLTCHTDLALSPGPSPPRRGLVHTACACAKYSIIFSVKSFVHFLVCMQKIILTKNTELYLK